MSRRYFIGLLVAIAILIGWSLHRMMQEPAAEPRAVQARGSDSANNNNHSQANRPSVAAEAELAEPRIVLTYDTITPSHYRFNATASRAADGAPLTRFEFDFGDGEVATVTHPVLEHSYSYVAELDKPVLRFPVTVTGYDENGVSSSSTITISFTNRVGVERAAGQNRVEASRCVMGFAPRDKIWTCTTTVRNTLDSNVHLDSLAISITVAGADARGKSMRQRIADGDAIRRPASPPFPKILKPGEIHDVTIELREDAIPDATRVIGFSALGTLEEGGQRARVSWTGVLTAKNTWVSSRSQ